MYKRYFLIFEEECRLYYCSRSLYGYNSHNQTVYKAQFTSNIQDAKKFLSIKEANDIIDVLPPSETLLHFLVSRPNANIKLTNLVVKPITFNFDS